MIKLRWVLLVVLAAVAFSHPYGVEEPPQEVPKFQFNVAQFNLSEIIPDYQERVKEVYGKLAVVKKEKEKVAILNDYIDDVLVNLNAFIIEQSLDPVEMPDIVEEFKWKVWPITYTGEMSLKNGWLQGMGSMKRQGDVVLSYTYPFVNMVLPLGFEKLLFNYDYRAKFVGLGPSGYLDGSVADIKLTFDFDIHMVRLRTSVENFKINNMGTIKLKFSGNVLVDWMVNIFVSVTIPMVKPILRIVIQGFVTGLLNSLTSVINNFVCLILGDCDALVRILY